MLVITAGRVDRFMNRYGKLSNQILLTYIIRT